MSLIEAIEKGGRLSPFTVPELRYLSAAAERVRERWPDVQVTKTEQEREALAQKLRVRVERDDWGGTRLSFVVIAASAVFDPERRDRPDLARTRDFIYAEIAATTSETLLSGLFRTYLDSYVPKGAHTATLATALGAAVPRMSPSERLLLDAVPELLDPKTGPDRLAARISEMSDPYMELLRLGVRNPHGGGFMGSAHLALTSRVRSHLSERPLIDWYIRWLRPPGKEEARTTGAVAMAAIEALIHPWLNKTPEDKLRSHLVETLIELYGDPRIKPWDGIDARYMAIVHRWLTREDMRFFTGVVDAVQKDNMWIKRRDFWLKLYDEGRIDEAWAALSSQAFEYAREHLMRQGAKNAYTRVGYQQARQNTSLLIMKIGNKIMVDGCHNYRTHVFDIADLMAPKLFEEGYDCDQIMRASPAAKPHGSPKNGMEPWRRWVRDMINADVARSQRTQPYTKVSRPRPPKPKYAAQYRPSGGLERETSQPDFSSGSRGGATSSLGLAVPSNYDRQMEVTPARLAASRSTARTSPRAQKDAPSAAIPGTSSIKSLKATRFPTLTDKMISYGPGAAAAVLAYLEAPGDGRTSPLLSPKSREGLARVRAVKGDLPLSLRNALEYLLINLKKSGVDLDDLFSKAEEPLMPAQPADPPATQSVVEASPETGGARYPLMPKTAEGRLEHLMKHVDALEAIGMSQAKFERRKDAVVSIKALRERPSGLLPSQIMDLMRLYDQLRQTELDELPASPAVAGSASAPPATAPKAAPASGAHKLPPLPDHPDERKDLLREHVDALEDLGMWKPTFEQRKAFAIAVRKLKEQSPDLRPTEIADLQSLYEELRQGGKVKRR